MTKDKKIVFAFGRMNPPTVGHEKLINTVLSHARAQGADHDIRLSHTQDSNKNPLSQHRKLYHLRKMFPNVNFSLSSKHSPSLFDHVKELYNKGYTHVTMVAGSDRVSEYQKSINKYNKPKNEGGEYHFKRIDVVTAGHRDPDAEGTEGMSASKMRQYAREGNFHMFKSGLPAHVSHQHARELYNHVREGMAIKECRMLGFKHWLIETMIG